MTSEQIIGEVLKNNGWMLDLKKKVWCFEKLRIPVKGLTQANYEYDGKLDLVCNNLITKLQFIKDNHIVAKTIMSLKNLLIVSV